MSKVDDRQLMIEGGSAFEAGDIVRRFGCYTTVLIVPISWAAIGLVMLWQGWEFVAWPFGVGPLAGWLVLIAVPTFWKMRAAMMTILDAVVKTAEAYLARAGWVIDINQDGEIGHARPEIHPPVEEVRPIIYRGRLLEERRLSMPATLPDEAVDQVGGGDSLEPVEDQPAVRVKVWHLPNGEKCHQEELERFVEGIFTLGWNRDTWLEQGMRREVYEGAVMLIEKAQILEGRKRGFSGRLNVRNARQARAILDLPPG